MARHQREKIMIRLSKRIHERNMKREQRKTDRSVQLEQLTNYFELTKIIKEENINKLRDLQAQKKMMEFYNENREKIHMIEPCMKELLKKKRKKTFEERVAEKALALKKIPVPKPPCKMCNKEIKSDYMCEYHLKTTCYEPTCKLPKSLSKFFTGDIDRCDYHHCVFLNNIK